jgi:hypothetical protein
MRRVAVVAISVWSMALHAQDAAPPAPPPHNAAEVANDDDKGQSTQTEKKPASSDDKPSTTAVDEPWRTPGIGFGGVPAINFDQDNGLGFGVIASMYMYNGNLKPYQLSITLQLFMTTKFVQDHYIVVDALKVAGLPLRVRGQVGYLQSLTQNYCGVGGVLSCDVSLAEKAADNASINDDEERDRFVRRYYQRRFFTPYGYVLGRYSLHEPSPSLPGRIEFTAQMRALYFQPGDWLTDEDGVPGPDLTPYPGSLYAADHPDGEAGLLTTVAMGFMYDSRDNEPAPTSGYFHEVSVRGSSQYLGSRWNNAGANLTLRGYTSLTNDKSLVLANRLTLDGVVGDVPVQEMARLGGMLPSYVFGGADVGRGIRVQRYLGKGRMVNMTELRWRFWSFELFAQRFALSTVGFVDAAIIADDIRKPTNVGAQFGLGGALRIAWNENFVVRADVGTSPVENWSPSLYLTINHPF